MAQQTINVGAAPNDGTGTPLRTAFQYTNSNFSELYTALGGGVGLPGATTQVIFNDGGTNLAGDAGLVYNKTTDALTIGGNVQAASAAITGDLTAARLIVTGGTIPTNGLWLPTTNTLEFAANSLAQYRIAPLGVFSWYDGAGGTRMTLNATGLGVGINPIYRFHVKSDLSELYFRDNGTASELLINSETGGRSALYFGDVADTVRAGIVYDSATDSLEIRGYNNVSRLQIDSVGNVVSNVTGTAPTLASNSQMVFNLTSNTNLRISVRGTDGVTRTANLTLAP